MCDEIGPYGSLTFKSCYNKPTTKGFLEVLGPNASWITIPENVFLVGDRKLIERISDS